MGIADTELGKTVLCVFVALYELSNLGLIEYDGSTKITPKGIALFDQIRVDWQPDKRMLETVVRSEALSLKIDVKLIQLWLDGELDA